MITKMCFHFSSSVLLTLSPYCAEQGLFDGPLPVHPISRQQQWQPAGLLLTAQLVGYISQYLSAGQWCIGGYMRVYGVYQPPGVFLTAYTHLSDHK